ncbi:MAG: hypothetical protein N2255_01595 [Kiritimatiellae bacterium]|nr:hypothetical protein [Kiritimatiellia bacterium]
MKLIDLLARLTYLGNLVFTVIDDAACLELNRPHAAKTLGRLAAAGHSLQLKRDLWGFPRQIDPFSLPEYVAAPSPAYVSLHSALYHHGLIRQIPSVVQAIRLART